MTINSHDDNPMTKQRYAEAFYGVPASQISDEQHATYASLPDENDVHKHICGVCGFIFSASADAIAWDFEKSPFMKCGHAWKFLDKAIVDAEEPARDELRRWHVRHADHPEQLQRDETFSAQTIPDELKPLASILFDPDFVSLELTFDLTVWKITSVDANGVELNDDDEDDELDDEVDPRPTIAQQDTTHYIW